MEVDPEASVFRVGGARVDVESQWGWANILLLRSRTETVTVRDASVMVSSFKSEKTIRRGAATRVGMSSNQHHTPNCVAGASNPQSHGSKFVEKRVVQQYNGGMISYSRVV